MAIKKASLLWCFQQLDALHILFVFIYTYKHKRYYVIQKPLTALDFMIESRVAVMQHLLIKENSQGS